MRSVRSVSWILVKLAVLDSWTCWCEEHCEGNREWLTETFLCHESWISLRGCSSSCSPQRHDLRFWRHTFWVRLFAHQPRQLNCHSHKIIEIMINYACFWDESDICKVSVRLRCPAVQAHLFVRPRWCWLEPRGPVPENTMLTTGCSRGLPATVGHGSDHIWS